MFDAYPPEQYNQANFSSSDNHTLTYVTRQTFPSHLKLHTSCAFYIINQTNINNVAKNLTTKSTECDSYTFLLAQKTAPHKLFQQQIKLQVPHGIPLAARSLRRRRAGKNTPAARSSTRTRSTSDTPSAFASGTSTTSADTVRCSFVYFIYYFFNLCATYYSTAHVDTVSFFDIFCFCLFYHYCLFYFHKFIMTHAVWLVLLFFEKHTARLCNKFFQKLN